MQEVGIVDELESPKDSTQPTYDEMQQFVAAAGAEMLQELDQLSVVMKQNSEAATRAAGSFQRLHEEATKHGIFDQRVWKEPSYKRKRAKLKKQKRKNGGPR